MVLILFVFWNLHNMFWFHFNVFMFGLHFNSQIREDDITKIWNKFSNNDECRALPYVPSSANK